jgi:hypothetical protein
VHEYNLKHPILQLAGREFIRPPFSPYLPNTTPTPTPLQFRISDTTTVTAPLPPGTGTSAADTTPATTVVAPVTAGIVAQAQNEGDPEVDAEDEEFEDSDIENGAPVVGVPAAAAKKKNKKTAKKKGAGASKRSRK